MLPEPGDRARLTEYLLGRLPESEVKRIEERYFADDDFFLLVGAFEQELMRDYLLRKLLPADVRSFERKYLSVPGLREKVEFMAAVMAVTDSLPASSGSKFSVPRNVWALCAAAVVLVALSLAAWQYVRVSRMEAQLLQMAARNAVVAAPPAAVPSFALKPALDRDSRSAPVVLRIAPDAASFVLSLEIEPGNEAARYLAVLAPPGGEEIWSGFTAPDHGVVSLTVPTRALPRGDYVLTLDARPGAAHEEYSFRVER